MTTSDIDMRNCLSKANIKHCYTGSYQDISFEDSDRCKDLPIPQAVTAGNGSIYIIAASSLYRVSYSKWYYTFCEPLWNNWNFVLFKTY